MSNRRRGEGPQSAAFTNDDDLMAGDEYAVASQPLGIVALGATRDLSCRRAALPKRQTSESKFAKHHVSYNDFTRPAASTCIVRLFILQDTKNLPFLHSPDCGMTVYYMFDGLPGSLLTRIGQALGNRVVKRSYGSYNCSEFS